MLTAASVASRAASLAWPYRFCTVPAASRARPEACVCASSVISPTAPSTRPPNSLAVPAIRSLSIAITPLVLGESNRRRLREFLPLKDEPAIDHDGLADNVGCKRRGQEQRGARHVGRRSQTLQRNPCQRTLQALWIRGRH